MGLLSLLLFLGTLVVATNGSPEVEVVHQIHPLRPQCGSAGTHVHGLSCLSWRFGVEAHNIIDWKTVPRSCKKYIGHYMLGKQYRKDSKAVVDQALSYAQSLKLAGDGKDVWVFDIDETTLSNLPYYAHHGFGVELYNATSFSKWVNEGKALALPESLRLYKKLLSLKFRIVFLTGRPESQGNVTAINLKKVGYHTFEKLLLKGSAYTGTTAVTYKSSQMKKLEKEGYRVLGNMGDQWSDILGTHIGNRTFKLPDPMYYIS
ncbi:hypothetical protein ACSBR2_042943 [Camellia fascicularis]